MLISNMLDTISSFIPVALAAGCAAGCAWLLWDLAARRATERGYRIGRRLG